MKIIRPVVEFFCWLWLLATTPPDHPEQPDPDMNRKLKSFLEASWLKWLWTMKLEAVLACLALIVFFKVAPYIRKVDDTAAWLDGGWLAFAIAGVLTLIFSLILYFIIVRAVLPLWDKWFDGDLEDHETPAWRVSMEKDWREAGPAIRLCIFFGMMATVILGVCVVTAAAF